MNSTVAEFDNPSRGDRNLEIKSIGIFFLPRLIISFAHTNMNSNKRNNLKIF